jgi:hypothetical protein
MTLKEVAQISTTDREFMLVALGSIIALCSQLVFFLLDGARENRKTKKALYIEFLSAVRQGFRIYEEIFDLQRDTKKIGDRVKKLEKLSRSISNKSSMAQSKRQLKRSITQMEGLVSRTSQLKDMLRIYTERMDEVISGFYLVAPEHVTMLASIVRRGFDALINTREDLQEMEDTFRDIANFLRSDSKNIILGYFHLVINFRKYRNWIITRKVDEFSFS